MTTKTDVGSKAAALNAQLALLNGGSLKIYSGSEPATTATALTSQTLLAECPLSATAFATTSTATATANAITSDAANASGTATFYRAYDSSDVCRRQGSAGESGTDLILDDAAIVTGGTVTISGWTVAQG